MYTENGLIVDLDEIRKVIEQADVFGVGFRLFGERLFVDTRTGPRDGPFIAAVAPLGGIQERMHWLGQQRPRFGMPERFAFFFWPSSIRLLQETGIWEAVTRRVLDSGDPSIPSAVEHALNDLHRLERGAIRDAVTGEQHRTIWEDPLRKQG